MQAQHAVPRTDKKVSDEVYAMLNPSMLSSAQLSQALGGISFSTSTTLVVPVIDASGEVGASPFDWSSPSFDRFMMSHPDAIYAEYDLSASGEPRFSFRATKVLEEFVPIGHPICICGECRYCEQVKAVGLANLKRSGGGDGASEEQQQLRFPNLSALLFFGKDLNEIGTEFVTIDQSFNLPISRRGYIDRKAGQGLSRIKISATARFLQGMLQLGTLNLSKAWSEVAATMRDGKLSLDTVHSIASMFAAEAAEPLPRLEKRELEDCDTVIGGIASEDSVTYLDLGDNSFRRVPRWRVELNPDLAIDLEQHVPFSLDENARAPRFNRAAADMVRAAAALFRNEVPLFDLEIS